MKAKKICSKEGCNYQIWSKGLCKQHSPKTPIKKVSTKQIEKNKEKVLKTKELHSWFLTLFDKLKEKDDKGYFVRCFETSFKMYEDNYKFNSCIYSHYLPKSTYPQYAFKEWNIELVTPDTHSQWEQNHTKCPKMYKKYLELKEKVLYL